MGEIIDKYKTLPDDPTELYTSSVFFDLGLNKIVSLYPEMKKYDKLFMELVKDGARFFDVIGSGQEGVILDIINKGRANYVAKFPLEVNRSFAEEYENHQLFLSLFYQGRQHPIYGDDFKHIQVPYMSTKYSRKGESLVMDRLEGYTLKNYFIRHCFSPLFEKNESLDDLGWLDTAGDITTKDNVIEHDCKNILHRELKLRLTHPEDIVASEYTSLLSTLNPMDEIFDLIGRWRDDSPEDLAFLDVLLGKKVGAHIRKLITSYHQFHLSQGVRHTDLHPGNIMIIPSKKGGLPDLGVIDFGRVHIDNRKEILKRYGIE